MIKHINIYFALQLTAISVFISASHTLAQQIDPNAQCNPNKVSLQCSYPNIVYAPLSECKPASLGDGWSFTCSGSCKAGTYTIDWKDPNRPRCKAPCVLASTNHETGVVACGSEVSCSGESNSYVNKEDCERNKLITNCHWSTTCSKCGKTVTEQQACVKLIPQSAPADDALVF